MGYDLGVSWVDPRALIVATRPKPCPDIIKLGGQAVDNLKNKTFLAHWMTNVS